MVYNEQSNVSGFCNGILLSIVSTLCFLNLQGYFKEIGVKKGTPSSWTLLFIFYTYFSKLEHSFLFVFLFCRNWYISLSYSNWLLDRWKGLSLLSKQPQCIPSKATTNIKSLLNGVPFVTYYHLSSLSAFHQVCTFFSKYFTKHNFPVAGSAHNLTSYFV